jgi:hypothetical protein
MDRGTERKERDFWFKQGRRIATITEIGPIWLKGVYFEINKNMEEIDFDPRDRWVQLK